MQRHRHGHYWILLLVLEFWMGSLPAQQPEARYASEGHWLVSEICQDIGEMLFYAKFHNAPSDLQVSVVTAAKEGVPEILVTASFPSQNVSCESRIVVSDSIWFPELYTAFAGTLISSFGLLRSSAKSSPETNTKVADSWLNLQPGTMEKENQRISQILGKDMLGVAAHEEAALLLGLLAFRERAGIFTDQRLVLCRMVAHLALSEALAPSRSSSEHGQLARILLRTVEGWQTKALDEIAEMKESKVSPNAQAMLLALSMRNTHDWRMLTTPRLGTYMERMEYLDAIFYCAATNLVTDFLRQCREEEIADVGRIILNDDFSVIQGHLFASKALQVELRDFSSVWAMMTSKPIKAEQICESLNAKHLRCVATNDVGNCQVRVVSQGTWTSFFQRHLCHSLHICYRFQSRMLAIPSAAREYRQEIEKVFTTLDLGPLLMLNCVESIDQYGQDIDKAISYCIRKPEMVNLANWLYITQNLFYARHPNTMPDPGKWFFAGLSAGPAFDAKTRLVYERIPEYLRKYKATTEIAPYNYKILTAYCQKMGSKGDSWWGQIIPDVEILGFFSRLSEYHASAMLVMAQLARGNSDKYEKIMEKACSLDSDLYITLGSHFKESVPDKAVKAYEKALELANPLLVANTCQWLVDYYYTHGQHEKALKLADMAAKVGSANGLLTMAGLLERMENYDEAEKYYLMLSARYNLDDVIIRFYQQHGRKYGYEKYGAKLKALTGEDPLQNEILAKQNEEEFANTAQYLVMLKSQESAEVEKAQVTLGKILRTKIWYEKDRGDLVDTVIPKRGKEQSRVHFSTCDLVDAVIPKLGNSLVDNDAKVRYYAAFLLADIIDNPLLRSSSNRVPPKWVAQTTALLQEAVKSPEVVLRKYAVDGLNAVSWRIASVEPALLQALDDEDSYVRFHAAVCIVALFSHLNIMSELPAKVARLVAEGIEAQDEKTREKAAGALEKIGEDAGEALPVLLKALKNERWEVRHTAASALANLGVSALPALPALDAIANQDSKRMVSINAKKTYAYLQRYARERESSAADIPLLLEDLKKDDKQTAIARIHHILESKVLYSESPMVALKNAVTSLVHALEDSEKDVKYYAAFFLGKMLQEWSMSDKSIDTQLSLVTEKALSGIVAALQEEDVNMRRCAAKILAKISGHRALPALPAIVNMLKDQDAQVKYHASLFFAECSFNSTEELIQEKIKELKDDVFSLFVEALQCQDDAIRKNAIQILDRLPVDPYERGLIKKSGIVSLLPVLLKMLDDKERETRKVAIDTMYRIGPDASVATPQLVAILKKAADSDTKEHAAKALGAIGAEAVDALPVLGEAVKADDVRVRRAASSALTRIRKAQQSKQSAIERKKIEEKYAAAVSKTVAPHVKRTPARLHKQRPRLDKQTDSLKDSGQTKPINPSTVQQQYRASWFWRLTIIGAFPVLFALLYWWGRAQKAAYDKKIKSRKQSYGH